MCGVIGITGPEQNGAKSVPCDAAYEAYRGLMALQHRGQDAAGILAYDPQTRMFSMEKNLGLVANVFDPGKIRKLTGYMALGHTRYATTGVDGTRDIQPLVTGVPFGLGMAHNGNIVNYFSLARRLAEEYGRQLLTTNDLEVMMHYWSHFLMNGDSLPTQETFSFDNIKEATRRLFETVEGGYAAVGMIAGQGLVAFRDPKGIRPLTLGRREDASGAAHWCVASETSSLTQLGYAYERDVAPGEVVFVDTRGNMQAARVVEDRETAPCMFEWVYFSGAESVIDRQPVYGVRLKLGERLGLKARAAMEKGEISPDVVMPVPDTSRTAAIAMADMLDLPYREGLIKNRYVGRSFILSTQEKREEAAGQKYIPITGEIEGKNILLVDDSIVRGTTLQRIVKLLKKYGAREVAIGVTCPPLRHPCFYGIDFPDPAQLIANGRAVPEIEKHMDVKRVLYLDEEDLRQATGISRLCMACLNNKYPTSVEEGEHFSRERVRLRSVT